MRKLQTLNPKYRPNKTTWKRPLLRVKGQVTVRRCAMCPRHDAPECANRIYSVGRYNLLGPTEKFELQPESLHSKANNVIAKFSLELSKNGVHKSINMMIKCEIGVGPWASLLTSSNYNYGHNFIRH